MTNKPFDTPLRLSHRVGPPYRHEPQDIVATKKALHELGFYDNSIDTDFGDWISNDFFQGIQNYQRSRGLKPDGIILNEGPTLEAINRDLVAVRAYRQTRDGQTIEVRAHTRAAPVQGQDNSPSSSRSSLTGPGQAASTMARWLAAHEAKHPPQRKSLLEIHDQKQQGRKLGTANEKRERHQSTMSDITLVFDGQELRAIQNGIIIKRWPAVSGSSGYQTSEYQGIRNKGPLPEGDWIVKQSEHQNISDMSLPERIVAHIPWVERTRWPNGIPAWGRDRIWLTPSEGTNTRNREGFSIHGGWTPGSAGCIDLTNQMDDFVKTFKSWQGDVRLIVSYPKKAR